MSLPTYYYAVLEFEPEQRDGIQALIDYVTVVEGPMNIIVDSSGGNIHLAMWLLQFLNEPCNRDRITLTAGVLISAGSLVWLGFRGRVATTPTSIAVVHQTSTNSVLRDGNRPNKSVGKMMDEIGSRTTWLSESLVTRFLPVELRVLFNHQHDVSIGPVTLDDIAQRKNNIYETSTVEKEPCLSTSEEHEGTE